MYNTDEQNGTASILMEVENRDTFLTSGRTPISFDIDLADHLVDETLSKLIRLIHDGVSSGVVAIYVNDTTYVVDETIWMPLYMELFSLTVSKELGL
jgi:hypothetical protein